MTDLEMFAGDEAKIIFALEYAASEVNLRSGFSADESMPYLPKYRMNVIEGAIYRLSMIGNEGQSSFSENGMQTHKIGRRRVSRGLCTLPCADSKMDFRTACQRRGCACGRRRIQ